MAVERGYGFHGVLLGRGSPQSLPHIPHLRMQRQLWAPALRRQKPNLRVPVRSVRAKVKCCTAWLGGSLEVENAQRLGPSSFTRFPPGAPLSSCTPQQVLLVLCPSLLDLVIRALIPWVSESLGLRVAGCLLSSVPFHIEREAEFRHHLHSFLGVEKSTHCVATHSGPHNLPRGLTLVPREQGTSLHTWSLKSGGNCRRMGGSAGRTGLYIPGSTFHLPSPPPKSSPTHPPLGRQGRLLRRTNQTRQGDPLCGTGKGLVGPWTCFCVVVVSARV